MINRLSSYLTLLLLAWPFACAWFDLLSGGAMLLVSAVLVLVLRAKRWDDASFPFVAFAVGGVFLTYMLRVPFLLYEPASFAYVALGVPYVEDLRLGVFRLFLYLLPLSLGVFVSARGLVGMWNHSIQGTLYRRRLLIFAMGFCFLFLRYLATKTLGVGMLVGDKSHGYLDRLLPYVVIIFSIASICVLYWRELDVVSKALSVIYFCLMVGYTLLLGSKVGVAYVLFTLALLTLLKNSNFVLKPRFILAFVLLSSFLVLFAFPYAQAFRYTIGSGFGLGQAFLESFVRVFENYDAMVSVSFFTARVSSGFDGIVALSYQQSEYLSSYFSFRSILGTIAQGLLPGVHYNFIPMGKAVGLAYSGHDITVAHAGNVGLLASSVMLVGNVWVFPFLFFVGWAFGGVYRLGNYIFRSSDLRYLLSALLLFLGIRFMMSGNYDTVAIRSIEYITHFFLIYVVIRISSIFMR